MTLYLRKSLFYNVKTLQMDIYYLSNISAKYGIDYFQQGIPETEIQYYYFQYNMAFENWRRIPPQIPA